MTNALDLTLEDVTAALGLERDAFAGACHSVSLAILEAGLVPGGRVARGTCRGVGAQHSWIAAGDPYGWDTPILDATLWTYRDDVEGLWVGSLRDGLHRPHGGRPDETIWGWGRPTSAREAAIEIETTGLSGEARQFLELIGPLDRTGWRTLLSQAPVHGWPAAEIVDRAAGHSDLRALIPIDRIGMLTDRNPGGVYRPAADTSGSEDGQR